MKRRSFLKTVALAGGAASEARPIESEAGRRTGGTGTAKRAAAIEYPRKFTGRQRAMIAFPLGGVGAGSISLGGRGQLRDWEIFNKPDKGRTPYAFPAIFARVGSKKPVVSVLEAMLMPPYQGSFGLGTLNAPGLPRLDSSTFTGEYPLAKVEFQDAALPVTVTLEAFTPFIPLDADDSGLPVAVLRYRVTNPNPAKAAVSIAFSIDNPVAPPSSRNDPQGRSNEHRRGEGIEGLFMSNPSLAPTDPLAGSFALTAIEAGDAKVTWLRGWRGPSRFRGGSLAFWEDLAADGELGPEEPARDFMGSLCLKRDIAPGRSAVYTFLLAWHFPNRTPERCGWKCPEGEEKALIGNWYSTRFADAWKAAEYAAANLPRLEKRTREFVAAMRQTTLPGAVRDAATANLSTFASTTCFRTADGAFHGFEGCNDGLGLGFGNCTHVWNYEASTPFIFPSLSRSLRENAFGFCTSETGAQDFRQLLPAGKKRWGIVAADGQMGSIMKLYLDWRLSADDAWLRRHWPAAKRALEYAWIPNGWDGDRDGVMEGAQHNTYDVEFFGPNPLCGVWYLGALRAAEEMARAVDDKASADEYRRLFSKGSKWIDENLFNGEYYVQKIGGMRRDLIPKEQMGGVVRTDTEKPEFQFGEGCLVDQLVGQYLADIAGLGDLLDPGKVRKALQSIVKYNYKPSLRRHASTQRTYALNDEAALILCDYGRTERPKIPFPYYTEAWAGHEYSAAALMMSRGLVPDGLRVVESVRRRHDGEKRNPWDEPEYGHHYARAMAAWAPLLLLSGFRYDGPGRRVEAKPRVNSANFTSFWSTGTGWGTFSQTVRENQVRFTLAVKAGALVARTVALQRSGAGGTQSSATAGKTKLDHQVRRSETEAEVTFAGDVKLAEGDTLVLLV